MKYTVSEEHVELEITVGIGVAVIRAKLPSELAWEYLSIYGKRLPTLPKKKGVYVINGGTWRKQR